MAKNETPQLNIKQNRNVVDIPQSELPEIDGKQVVAVLGISISEDEAPSYRVVMNDGEIRNVEASLLGLSTSDLS